MLLRIALSSDRVRPRAAFRDGASKRTVSYDEMFGRCFASCGADAIGVNSSLSGLSVVQQNEYQWNPRYALPSDQSGLSCVLAYWTGSGILDSFVVYY